MANDFSVLLENANVFDPEVLRRISQGGTPPTTSPQPTQPQPNAQNTQPKMTDLQFLTEQSTTPQQMDVTTTQTPNAPRNIMDIVNPPVDKPVDQFLNQKNKDPFAPKVDAPEEKQLKEARKKNEQQTKQEFVRKVQEWFGKAADVAVPEAGASVPTQEQRQTQERKIFVAEQFEPSVKKRFEQFREPIVRYAEQFNLDPNLLTALIWQESKFDPQAESGKGAFGLTQLTPIAIQDLKERFGVEITDIFDPEQQILGGAAFLRGMIDQFNGDVTQGLAAYNAGQGAVAQAGGVPEFPETQNYVQSITGLTGEPYPTPEPEPRPRPAQGRDFFAAEFADPTIVRGTSGANSRKEDKR